MPSRIESLALIHQACWLEVERAAHQRDHAFRVMALATLDGNVADLRSVVIREVDAADRSLVFFTDSRSPKVAQMRAQPLATMLTWCPNLGWQLRLRVRLDIETSGLTVSSRWARLKMTPAAHDYLSPLPPGSVLERFEPERASRDHFAVVNAQVLSIDWLELHADGHRRALFDAEGNGQWMQP